MCPRSSHLTPTLWQLLQIKKNHNTKIVNNVTDGPHFQLIEASVLISVCFQNQLKECSQEH